MFALAAPGTWPALWLLPSDNLIEPKSTVAEIDAVQFYGTTTRCLPHHALLLERTQPPGDRAVWSPVRHRAGGHAMAGLRGHR